MKKGMILSAALSVVALMLVSCAGEPEATTTTTRQTTVTTAAPPPTGFADDDNNDAHGRRLLIAKAGRGYVCRRHGPVRAVSAFQQAALNSTGHRPVATVVTRSGFLSGRFCALGFLFLGLTHYGRDRLKLFAIAEIH